MKISVKRTPDGTYQICAQGKDEDFYSVLAEVKESNFCPEHKLNACTVAVDLAAAYAYQFDFKS